MNHFVFTGPESSGKTTLALKVASHTSALYQEECARDYLFNLGRDYVYSDLLEIATLQYHSQEEMKKTGEGAICLDTDLITLKIWSEYKYGKCDPWILERILSNKKAFYILCSPDIPWEEDELRENPNDREELFQLYWNTLKDLNLKYVIVKGSLEERMEVVASLLLV